ncbi:hypothetical protein CYMTET_11541 [Cymbomonas tetramitiformis]|uniref:Phosphate acetyl/butaryl transferase domain-containing protein n=1 Tax=Cymbomonas tetramitiformis TaxID=36881 RepID=A0AAE0GM47_9CHLO|nr:hypothetical protein CYMTET_11541 [Cymbomonas tetramitiformis]
MMVKLGDADAMIGGATRRYSYRGELSRVKNILGLQAGLKDAAALEMLVMPNRGAYFFTDTMVAKDPDAKTLAATAVLASDAVARYEIQPRVAMLSHTNFGSDEGTGAKVAEATQMVKEMAPYLEVDGEMQPSAALDEAVRESLLLESSLTGNANVLVLPNLDAATISCNLVKELSNGMQVGPISLGLNGSVQLVASSITTRGLLNMTAVAAVEAHAFQSMAEVCDGGLESVECSQHTHTDWNSGEWKSVDELVGN